MYAKIISILQNVNEYTNPGTHRVNSHNNYKPGNAVLISVLIQTRTQLVTIIQVQTALLRIMEKTLATSRHHSQNYRHLRTYLYFD